MNETRPQPVAENESAAADEIGDRPATSPANPSPTAIIPQPLPTTTKAATIPAIPAAASTSISLQASPASAVPTEFPDSVGLAKEQLNALQNQGPKRFIQKITVIDTKKLQQLGLDRRIAEALSKHKVGGKQEAKTKTAAAAVGTPEATLDISKLTPAERLAHAKKLLNQKLLAIVPSTSKAAAAATSSSQSSSMLKPQTYMPVANKFYTTIKLEKEEPIVYKKLPILPPKSPQEIARVLDFSGSSKKTPKLDKNAPQFVHNFHLSQKQSLRTCVATAEQQVHQMMYREQIAKQRLDNKMKIETNEYDQSPGPKQQIKIIKLPQKMSKCQMQQLQPEQQQLTQEQEVDQSRQRLEQLAQVRALNRAKCEAYERRTQLALEQQEHTKYVHLPQKLNQNQEHEATRQTLQQHLRVQAEKISKQAILQKQEETQQLEEKRQRQIEQKQQKLILQQQLQQKQKLQEELKQTQKQQKEAKNLPSLQSQLLYEQLQIKPLPKPQQSISQLQLQPPTQLHTQKPSKQQLKIKLQPQIQPQLQPQPQAQPQPLPIPQTKLQKQQQLNPPQPHPQSQPLPTPLPKLQAKLQEQQQSNQPQPQSQPLPTPQPKLQPKPQEQQQSKQLEQEFSQSQSKQHEQPHPQTKQLAHSQLQTKLQSHPQLKVKPQLQLEAQPQPQPQPQSQPQPQPQPQPQSQPRLQPQPQPQLQPRSQMQSQSQAQKQSQPQFQAQKQPQPQLQMQIKQQIQLKEEPKSNEQFQLQHSQLPTSEQPQKELLETPAQPQKQLLQTAEQPQKQLQQTAEQPQKQELQTTEQPQQQQPKLEVPPNSKRKSKIKPQLKQQPQVTPQSESKTTQSQLHSQPIPQEQQLPQSSTPSQQQLETLQQPPLKLPPQLPPQLQPQLPPQQPPKQLPLQQPLQKSPPQLSPKSSQQPPPQLPSKPPQDHHHSSNTEPARTIVKPQLTSNAFRSNLTYEDIFEKFNKEKDVIPKASIRPANTSNTSKPQTPPSSTRTYSKHNSSTSFTLVSPLKEAFPTTTLPQEAPLPQISTFKKPFPLPQKLPPGIPKNITITIADDLTYTIKPHPLNLIVLEDKVLTQAEKLDLTLFGLAKPKLEPDADSPTTATETDDTDVNAAVQTAELPAIGATISTDPHQTSVVVNATQPKKFIIAPDKLKLSKEKIAALAKQIKTQALQQTRTQQNVGQTHTNTQTLQLQTKMSRSGSVIQLQPSPTALEISNDGKNITVEVKTMPPKEQFPKIDSIAEMQPLATTTASSSTPDDAFMTETLPESVPKQENIRKVGKIIKLETRQPIRYFSNKPILQDANVVVNAAGEQSLLQKPNMSLTSQQPHLPLPYVSKTSAEWKRTMGQPKIIKIVSSQSSEFIIPKPPMKPVNIEAVENEEIFTPNDFGASTSTAAAFFGRKSSSAVRILDNTEADASSLSAVDFVAALAASTDYAENSPFELSAEELNLKATLGMSFSPLKQETSPALQPKCYTKSADSKASSCSTDATALLTQMLSNDDLKNNITLKTMELPQNSHTKQQFGRYKNEEEHQDKKAETAHSREQDSNIYTYGYLSVQSQTIPVYSYDQIEPHNSAKVENQIAENTTQDDGADIEDTRYEILNEDTSYKVSKAEEELFHKNELGKHKYLEKDILENRVDGGEKNLVLNPVQIQTDSMAQKTVLVSDKTYESSRNKNNLKLFEEQEHSKEQKLKEQKQTVFKKQELFNKQESHNVDHQLGTNLSSGPAKDAKAGSGDRLMLNAEVKDAGTVPREGQTKANKRAPRIKKGKINLVPRKKSAAAKGEIKTAQEPSEPQTHRTISKDVKDLIPRTDASTTEQECSSLHYKTQASRTSSTDSAEETLGERHHLAGDVASKLTRGMTKQRDNKERICELEVSANRPTTQPLVKDSTLSDTTNSAEEKKVSSLQLDEIKTSEETPSLQPYANDTFPTHTKVNTEVKYASPLQSLDMNAIETSDKIPSSPSDCAKGNNESDELGLTPHSALEILQGTSQPLKTQSISTEDIKSIPNILNANEQKAKETEAAQILVSLIQPPSEKNEEHPLPVAKNPFKRKSLEIKKSAEKVIGIQNLLQKIEDNQLQKNIGLEEPNSGQDYEITEETTIPENSGQEKMPTKTAETKLFEENQGSEIKQTGIKIIERENKVLRISLEKHAAQETLCEVSQLSEPQLKQTKPTQLEIQERETATKAVEADQTKGEVFENKAQKQTKKDEENEMETTNFKVEKTHAEGVSKKMESGLANVGKIHSEPETPECKPNDDETVTPQIEKIQLAKNRTRRSKSRTAEREIVVIKATKATTTKETSTEAKENITEIIVTMNEEKRQTRQSTSEMVEIKSGDIDKDISVVAEKKEDNLTKNAHGVKVTHVDDAADLKNMKTLTTKDNVRKVRRSESKTLEKELISSAEGNKAEVAFETGDPAETSAANNDEKTPTFLIKVEKPQTRRCISKRNEGELTSNPAGDKTKETSGLDLAKEVSGVHLMAKTETLPTKGHERQTRSSKTKITEREFHKDGKAVKGHDIDKAGDTSNVNIINKTESHTPKTEKRQTRSSESKSIEVDLLSSSDDKVEKASETDKVKETFGLDRAKGVAVVNVKAKTETPANKDDERQTRSSKSKIDERELIIGSAEDGKAVKVPGLDDAVDKSGVNVKNKIEAKVEKRQTRRSEPKTSGGDLLSSPDDKVEPASEADKAKKTSGFEMINKMETHTSKSEQKQTCPAESVAVEGEIISSTEEDKPKALAVVDIVKKATNLDVKNITELTTEVEKRQTRRSKSKTVERELISTIGSVATEVAAVINEPKAVKAFEGEEGQKQPSKPIIVVGNLLTNLEGATAQAVSDIGREEVVVEPTETLTAKCEKGLKRVAQAKSFTASLAQTAEEGETVAKKRRTCSLVSFETSFVSQNKDEPQTLENKEPQTVNPTSPTESYKEARQLSVTGEHLVLEESLKPALRTYIKPRHESKQSTADTQSDIDITDIDFSTREDSNDNDETAKEESSQDSKINKTSRKRLRKTLDDIKRGRVAEINTDETDSDDDYNGDMNEFLGFDEFLPNAHNTDETTRKPIATKRSPVKTAQANKQDGDNVVSSSAEKLRTKQLKDWLTTGKAGQPPLAKVAGKKVAITATIKQATKTMPLKKRWELVQQRPHVETDITDDTSPAHDDDDDAAKVAEETIRKRKLDVDAENELKSEDDTVKKLKLTEHEQSGEEHVFVKPQLKVTPVLNVKTSDIETAQPSTSTVRDIEALQTDELMPDLLKPLAEPYTNEIANTGTSLMLPKKRGRKPLETSSSDVTTKLLCLSTQAEVEVTLEQVSQQTSTETPDTTLATTFLPKKRGRKPASRADNVTEISKHSSTQHSSAVLVETIETEHNETQVVAELAQTDAVDNLVSTPLPKKRGRKPKVLHTPQESKELSVEVLTETPGSTQDALVETFLPTKRGRKPKRFFEDIEALTSTPNKPTTSIVRTNSMADSESSINDSMATETAVSTAAGPRKRGRKPKGLSTASNLNEKTANEQNTVIAEASDATSESQATQEALGEKRRRQSKTAAVQETPTVMDKTNEPKSIIEIFTSSISTNPIKSETCNETLGDALRKALSDTLDDSLDDTLDEKLSDIPSAAAKSKAGDQSTRNSVEIQSKNPLAKKRVPKKRIDSKIVAQNITSTDLNDTVELNTTPIDLTKFNKDSIFPRILLIRKREQLDNDETLTKNTGQPEPGYAKCALCLDNIKNSKWSQHLSEHYGVGWKLGKTPMDISSRNSVVNIIIYYLKDTHVKGLNCRICQRLYRSGLGVIMHLESCGVSVAEQQKNRIQCEYCKNTYTPLSYKQHERTCSARMALEKQEATNNMAQMIEATTAEVLNNVGRVKRRSQLKAEHKLKVIGEQLLGASKEVTEFAPENHIQFEAQLCAADCEEQFLKDLKKFGKGFCPCKICRFTCLNFAELEQHLTACKLMRKSGYHCMLCKTKQVFATQELAVQHVKKQHQPRAESHDFNGSESSDCKIDDAESSSEDCSSGVDSNKEDDEEEGNSGDDGKNDDSANDYGRERKKIKMKPSKPNQSVIRPILNSTKKQLYPTRVGVNVNAIYDKWKQFTRKNYSDAILFDYGAVNFTLYAEKMDNFEKLLPRQDDSMKFTFSTKHKVRKIFGIPEPIDDWRQLKRFETLTKKYDHFTFIGAPIKVLAWAPLPKHSGHTQYLAVSYRKDMDKYTHALNPKIEPALILIYKINMKAKEPELEIQLHYAMRIPNGPVHCFDFLPSGGYAHTANRLGLLAVGTACSEVQVYALPLTITDEENRAAAKEHNDVKQFTESKLTVLDLKTTFVLSLDLSAMQQRIDSEGTIQCTCLKWSEFRDHNLIFCGFSNGFVGIWDVSYSENENLNSFLVNAVRHFVPLNYFFCGERGVRDLALHYDSMGLRWLAICAFGRKAVIYDLRELTNPVIVRDDCAKNVICALEWPVMGENVAMSMSDAIINNGTCLVLRSPLSISFTTSKIENMISAVNQAKFNPCQSVYYSVTDNGDILFHSLRELNCGLRRKLHLSAKAITTLDVKCLNGDKMPVHGDKTARSFHPIESNYKEMYGLVFAPVITFTPDVDKAFKSLTRLPPFYMRRLTRINCLSSNVNTNGSKLVAFGYENGFLRIVNFNESKHLT